MKYVRTLVLSMLLVSTASGACPEGVWTEESSGRTSDGKTVACWRVCRLHADCKKTCSDWTCATQ